MNRDSRTSSPTSTNVNPYIPSASTMPSVDPYKQFKQERKARKEAEKQAKKELKYRRQSEKCENKSYDSVLSFLRSQVLRRSSRSKLPHTHSSRLKAKAKKDKYYAKLDIARQSNSMFLTHSQPSTMQSSVQPPVPVSSMPNPTPSEVMPMDLSASESLIQKNAMEMLSNPVKPATSKGFQ